MTSPTAPPQPDPHWLAGRRDNRVRLSRDQQRTWLVDQLSTLPGGYLTPVFLHLDGPLDRRALIEAVRAVAERHEVLRTSVGQDADGLVGILRPASDVSVSCDDLDADDLQAFLERESQTPLDVAAGPPPKTSLKISAIVCAKSGACAKSGTGAESGACAESDVMRSMLPTAPISALSAHDAPGKARR